MQTFDLETEIALEFVLEQLGSQPCHVLEVGCGQGELALALQLAGHRVFAIEPKAEAVALARSRGVDAHPLAFPDPTGEVAARAPFDAALFARSLHHMPSAEAAVQACLEHLRPGSPVIVDDWAWEEMNEATLAWFASFLDFARGVGWPVPEWPREPSLVEAWRKQREDHEGALLFGDEWRACQAQLETTPWTGEPWFYRYVWRALRGHEEARARALAFRRHERELIEAGVLTPLGRRWVARTPESRA